MFLYVFLGTVPTFNVVMNYVSWFCFLYLVAAYIRLYPHDKGKWSLYLAALILVACCSVIMCLALGKTYNKEMAYRFVSDSNTFIAFAIAICNFMLFKNLKIRHSNFINAIGGSTFGVLCIHANSNAMREWLWQTVFDVKGHFSLPTIQLILYSIGCVILTFVCCTVLDLLRKKYIEQPVMNRIVLNRHFRQLDAFFEFIVNTKF